MEKKIEINSIREIHEFFKYDERPANPLITILDLKKVRFPKEMQGQRFISKFYAIFLKENFQGELIYGREYYDFSDGSMTFILPGQSVIIEDEDEGESMEGWVMFIHPDLFEGTRLENAEINYSFFAYKTNEALHLSDKEKDTLTHIVEEVKNEYSSTMDNFSHELMISNIELLLNYCKRYYGRQFLTRRNVNSKLVKQFEKFLKERIYSPSLKDEGIPSVKECAEHMCLSPDYLSDLLKKESGKTAKEYVQEYMIKRAKQLLLNTDDSLNNIAFNLGFEYPEYFSKYFKKQTGINPSEFRKIIHLENSENSLNN